MAKRAAKYKAPPVPNIGTIEWLIWWLQSKLDDSQKPAVVTLPIARETVKKLLGELRAQKVLLDFGICALKENQAAIEKIKDDTFKLRAVVEALRTGKSNE